MAEVLRAIIGDFAPTVAATRNARNARTRHTIGRTVAAFAAMT